MPLVDQFSIPAFIINSEKEILEANQLFMQQPILSTNKTNLPEQLEPLINGEQDRLFLQLTGIDFVFTALPMIDHTWLIKCSYAQSSALSHRYQTLVSVINNMSDSLIICDASQRLDFVSQSVYQLFPQLQKHEFAGKPIISFVTRLIEALYPSETQKNAARIKLIKRKTKRGQSLNLLFENNQGTHIEYRDQVTQTGERVGLLIDVSKSKALNEQLEAAYNEAFTLSKAKSNFMAAMSHEVRTPLNAIIGILDICMQDQQLRSSEYLPRIQRNAQHLLRLINDVLDFTKFEAEKVELALIKTNIRRLAENLFESYASQAYENNVAMLLFVDPTIPTEIMIDDVRLTQVLNNLISNALKFNQSHQPVISLKIVLKQPNNRLRISVSDNGIGIDPSMHETIFSGFMQASPEIHRRFGGSGLGLSICRKICHMMGGELNLRSALHKGSCFYVNLPLDSSVSELKAKAISTKQSSTLCVMTNDELFFKLLRFYSRYYKYQCKLISAIPNRLASRQYLCIAQQSLDDGQFSAGQRQRIALIRQSSRHQEDTKLRTLSSIPFKLDEFLEFIGLQANKPVSSSDLVCAASSGAGITTMLKVLVVEDNEDNMFVLQEQFKLLNVYASFSLSSEEAVILFEQQSFDIVISDYQMPIYSGAQLISQLRKIEQFEQRSPCLMYVVTADKTKFCFEDCMAAKADDVIMKPLTLKLLVELLSNDQHQVVVKAIEPMLINSDLSSGTEDDSIDDDFLIIGQEDDSSENSAQSHSVFDVSVLYTFVGEISEHDTIDYLTSFCRSLKKLQTQMRQFCQENNWQLLKNVAHSLKSSSLIVGAELLSDICQQLEQACLSELEDQVKVILWHEADTRINELIDAIDEQYRGIYAEQD